MIAPPVTATMAAMAVLWTLLSNTLRKTEVLTPKRAIPTKAWMILAGIYIVSKDAFVISSNYSIVKDSNADLTVGN